MCMEYFKIKTQYSLTETKKNIDFALDNTLSAF